jgi:hypothetical protein
MLAITSTKDSITMKLNLKTTGIILASVLTAFSAINSSVRAEDNQIKNVAIPRLNLLGCQTTFVKEFTQVPVIKNTGSQTIPTGQVIKVRSYLKGKQYGSQQSVTLGQPLAPQQTYMTGIKLQGDSGFTCTASY